MTDWKDATTYAQGERGNKSPNAWDIEICGIRIFITKNHIHFRPDWAMLSRETFDTPIKIADANAPLELVKIAAVSCVEGKLRFKADRYANAADAILAYRKVQP